MMAKRKKKAPKVGGDAASYKAKLEREGSPHVKFLADLDKYDRSYIGGKDKNKHYYWGKEKDDGFHRSQGYTKSDGKGLSIAAPGGSTFWAPEGNQSGKAGEGLVLYEMPLERYKAREEYRSLKNNEYTESLGMKKDKRPTVDGGSDVFTPEGDFLKDLSG